MSTKLNESLKAVFFHFLNYGGEGGIIRPLSSPFGLPTLRFGIHGCSTPISNPAFIYFSGSNFV